MNLTILTHNVLILFLGISLHCEAQKDTYRPSLSDMSGNGPSADGKGYIYNFNGNIHSNCTELYSNGSFNQFNSKNYSYHIDTLNGYFNFSFNGEQEKTEVMCNHFSAEDCFFIESSSNGYIDLSDEKNRIIELRIRSNVYVEKFGVYILTVNENGLVQIGDGDDHISHTIKPNKWLTLQTEAIFTLWNGTALDPSKVIGIALYARSSDGVNPPTGTIEIDYIRTGSSVHSSRSKAKGRSTSEGYTYNFSSSDTPLCTKQMNTLRNDNFSFSVDHTNAAGILTQKNTSSRYNLFAMEFTDDDCFLKKINLEDKTFRFVEIKIKPDIDIHTFGLSISGNKKDNKEWDYSIPENSVPLKGGQWNIIKLPVSLSSNSGSTLIPSEIRGLVFAFNHHTPNNKPSSASINYVIEYIKVGKNASE